jgi:hypothetical protein
MPQVAHPVSPGFRSPLAADLAALGAVWDRGAFLDDLARQHAHDVDGIADDIGGGFCPLGPVGMVGLELREIMGLAVAIDDLHIADVSLDPLLGKLDRIEWAVRLRSKAYTVRGEPSYEVPRRLLHGAKHIGSPAARYRVSRAPHSN